jgi:hypothetical protein
MIPVDYSVWTRHNCDSTHKTYNKIARCLWGEDTWIFGDGPYASLVRCHGLVVHLYQDQVPAVEAQRSHNYWGCRQPCKQKHRLIYMDIPLWTGGR